MEGCSWCLTLQYYVLISQVGHPDIIEGSVSTNKCGDQHHARGQGMVTGLSNQGMLLGTKHLTQQPQDIPCNGPCCWCLRKHLMTSSAIGVLQEELHHKLAFQIIGCYDALCFCDEVLHWTIPKLSAEFGESWWRHPWSMEPEVAAWSIRGSHRCHVLSSVWVMSVDAKCDRSWWMTPDSI